MSFAALDGIIDLHFQDDSGRVFVTPNDKDSMLMSVNEAIEACRAFTEQLRFRDQFNMLLDMLGVWIKAHSSHVSHAVLTVRDAGLLLLIVSRSPAYDKQLESDITDLDIQVANDNDYELINLSILAIPSCQPEAVQSFLSKKMQLRYTVDGGRK